MDIPEEIDLFISARFDGGEKEEKARELYDALKQRGNLKVFMVHANAGDDFGKWTDKALYRMEAMVAVCFDNYGQRTENKYCTYYEVRYARTNSKRIIPLKLYKGNWPPEPRDHDNDDDGPAQNRAVFYEGLGYRDWSTKRWNAKECAEEIENCFLKKVNNGIKVPETCRPHANDKELERLNIQLVGPRKEGKEWYSSYLHAAHHNDSDKRDDGSTYACFADETYGIYSQWTLEPVEGKKNTYYIKFCGERNKSSSPNKSYLHVGDHNDSDKRDDGSTYVCVADKKYGEHSQWTLEPVKGKDTYYIKFCGKWMNEYNKFNSSYLHVAHHYDADKRDDGSTYACVAGEKHGEYSQFVITPSK